MTHSTVKVPLALDAAVILAGGRLELDADPVARRKVRPPSKPDDPTGTILKLDDVPDLRLHGQSLFEEGSVSGWAQGRERVEMKRPGMASRGLVMEAARGRESRCCFVL